MSLAKLKKNIGIRYRRWKAVQNIKRKEQAIYRRELNKEVTIARREAFKKEAVKQARVKARIKARIKYNPPKSASGMDSWQQSMHSAINFDEPKKGKKKKKKYAPFEIRI